MLVIKQRQNQYMTCIQRGSHIRHTGQTGLDVQGKTLGSASLSFHIKLPAKVHQCKV